jgi:tetratricopeptide (TPR) repeat protein
MTTDRLLKLQKRIQTYYEQLECQENALLTCEQIDRSSIKQQIDRLTQEIIPVKKDYWQYWGEIGARQLEITDLEAEVIDAEIIGEVEMLRFQREVQHHGEVVKLLDQLQATLTQRSPAAGKLRAIIPVLPEFLAHDMELDTEGVLRRVFPIFSTLNGKLTKDLNFGEASPLEHRGRESIFQGESYANDGSKPNPAPKRLFGAAQIRQIPVWVGREKVLTQLYTECMNGRKVIVLWGQSGIGKTSLAVKLMAACGVDFATETLAPTCPYDNALYCDVTADGFDFLVAKFLSAFGMSANRFGATSAQVIEMILTKLSQQRWLVVIDNLQLLLDADTGKSKSPDVGEFLHRLAYGVHKSQIVITNRQLPADLLERGGKKLAGIPVKENRNFIHAESIRGISNLDSIQLLRNLGVQDSQKDAEWIVDRVRGQVFALKLLADRARHEPGKLRQEPNLVTKEATPIAQAQWAAQTPDAQELLRRMCVLRHGVNLRALTILCSLEAEGGNVEYSIAGAQATAELLANLVDDGLVEYAYDTSTEEHIYGLHSVMAQSLQVMCSSTELTQLWRSAAKLYGDCVGVAFPTADRPPVFRSLEDWRLVLEEWHFFWLLGKYEVISQMAIDSLLPQLGRWGYSSLQWEWCERILPHTDGANYRYCLQTLGCICRDAGRFDEAENYFKLSLADAEQAGVLSEIAASSATLGSIARHRGNWDEAEALYKKALRLQTELQDRHGMTASWGCLGDIARQRGHWDRAEAFFQKSLRLRTTLGDRLGTATNWSCLGDIARHRGYWDDAETMFLKSLQLHTEIGDRSGIATNWSCLGDIARHRGNWDEAESLYQKSLKLRTELGDTAGMATNWGCLGDIANHRGNWDEAEALFQRSLKLRTELGDTAGMATAWSCLGNIAHHRSNWDEADSLFLKSLKLRTELGDSAGMAANWDVMGDIARNRSNWDEADALYRKSLKLHTELGDNAGMATAWSRLGNVARNRGNWAEADTLYRKSLKLHTEVGDGAGMATAWGILGDIAWNRGHWDEAETLFQKSLKLRTELGDRPSMAANWDVLGDIARHRGHWDEAETLFQKSLTLRSELGDRSGMATNWGVLGSISRHRGDWAKADTLYRKSLRLHTELGDSAGMASNWSDLGDISRHQGNWDDADALYRKSLKLHTELGNSEGMASNWGCLGEIAHNRGHWDEAEALYQKCLRLHTELNHRPGIANSLGDLGKNELGRGNFPAAKILLTKSLAAKENLKMFDGIAATNWDLAQLYRAQGDNKRAQGHYSIALNLYTQLGADRDLAKIQTTWANNAQPTTGWQGIVTRYFPTAPTQ